MKRGVGVRGGARSVLKFRAVIGVTVAVRFITRFRR